MISLRIPWLFLCLAGSSLADEPEIHRFSSGGGYQAPGWPEQTPKLLVLAEKPLRLFFTGHAADWQPAVQVHRITAARKISLTAPEAEAVADGWQWSWTPPASSGPAHYEIRFEGEPARIVRIESRDPKWLEATLKMLSNQVDWQAQGLTHDESAALGEHDIQTEANKAATASLTMIPREGAAARRRVVWDEENPALVVWRPGPSVGDLEIRAPRWWLSPAALATDHGLIRFLDLFSEPPLNP